MKTAFDIAMVAAKVVAIFAFMLSLVPVLIWMERKGAAYIQDRRGPNRAAIFGLRLGGLLHSLADSIKLLAKEEVAAGAVSRPLYYLAPVLAFFVATVTVAVVPFAEPVSMAGYSLSLQVADLQAGLIYVFAMSSLGVYAIVLAGWASNNKYSLLGALRASAQFISYELAMGFAAVAIFIVAGSLRLSDIIADQGALPWHWNVVRQPLAFLIFFAALVAQTNRLPFDLPEGEAEIVAGYHVEYSSMRFAMFFIAEYAHIIVGSAIVATLFFGGWQVPFVTADGIRANAAQIVAIGWPAASALCVFLGGAIALRFERRYHDARDYEPLVLGAPLSLVGIALAVVYLLSGSWELLPWAPAAVAFLIQMAMIFAKTIFICAVFIWLRWTLPRFRYDQIMRLGWKAMLPLGVLNVIATTFIVLVCN